jgi:hypothetical protein
MGEGLSRAEGESLPTHWRSAVVAFGGMLALFATALLALFAVTPAQAFLHRGHTFAGALETTGENKLSEPSAVVVNEKTTGEGAGDIYVLDKGNNRVVRFGPNHEFLEAWGAGVSTGGESYERCTEEAACKPGRPGFGTASSPAFDEPVAIAVDNSPAKPGNSSGDVYVVANRTWKRALIYKFDFEGKLVDRFVDKPEEKEEPWPIAGIAVDRSGVVWVDREAESEEVAIERFSNATKNKLLGEPETFELPEVASSRPVRPGFAIDGQGHVYVTYEPEGRTIEEEEELFEERAEKRHENKEPPVDEHLAPPCETHICLVAQLKVTLGEEERIEGEVEVPQIAPEENSTGVAVDTSLGAQSSGDVYIDNDTSVSAFTSGGTLIQTFGQAQLGEGGGRGLVVDSVSNEVLVADQAHGRVDLFGPVPPGPPVIEEGSVSATNVTAESSKLTATIDPTGNDTHYFFRYGTEPCLGGGSCALAPALPGTDIGSGFGDQPASVEVKGLTPGTTYHFVAVAKNGFGEVESQHEGTFKTLSANTLESVLPDGRAWELVSPVNKRGVSVEPLSHEGGLIQASAGGRGFAFIASAPVGDEEPAGNRAPEPSQLVAKRSSAGSWSTRNLTTPNLAAQGIQANTRREYQAFSSDLSLGAVFPVEPLQSSETTSSVTGLPVYLRNTDCGTAPCYSPLTSTSTALAGASPLDGATPDLQHVGLNLAAGLFEWSAQEASPGEGHLRQVNILPSGKAATGEIGFGAPELTLFEGARNAISRDGSHVVWAQREGVVQHLFQSDLLEGTIATSQIDEQNEEEGLPAPTVLAKPVYQASSVNQDRVFFTDNQRLTANASHGRNSEGTIIENEEAGDLYVYERDKPAGARLTDLTPSLNEGESSAVQAGVIGASEDGSYVYFVANGVLAEGASPGKCIWGGVRSAKCNLYEVHNDGSGWESPRFIARLSNEDGPDWGPVSSKRTEYKVDEMTSRVSPNGRFLAFMSSQRLTGYNNLDANSGEPDEEVFLFDAGTGRLVCASCNPSGARPVGVHDVQESGEGRGLVIDRLAIWSTETEETAYAHWLAANLPGWTNLDDRESLYQSRYLSNDGRLFFNAADALAKADVNGKADVYQYEPVGTGDCTSEETAGGCVALISSGKSEHETAFLDASETGNDVFFLTSASLIPSLDTDKAFDIYDARVCDGPGAEEACPSTAVAPPPPCTGEDCRSAQSSPPSFSSPGTANAAGSGNVVPQVLGTKQAQQPNQPTKAQKLAAALKSCKKKYKAKKHKRAACEKQARKKYGGKKSTSSAKGKKSSSKGR